MKWFLYLSFISTLILSACEAQKSVPEKMVQFEKHSNTLNQKDTLNFKLLDTSAKLIAIEVNNKSLRHQNMQISLDQLALGKHVLSMRLETPDGLKTEKKEVQIYASQSPKKWQVELVNTYIHNTNYYTQGLEFVGDVLYESTGQKGRSIITSYNPFSSKQYKSVKLDSLYFGEGITVVDDRLIQLTWQAKKGFVYDLNSLEKISEFSYGASSEGWGLAHDRQYVYKSDGSEYIFKLDLMNLTESDYLTVTSNTAFYKNANELEIVGDYLFANVYQKNSIMVIDKYTGALVAVIDLGFLTDKLTKDQNFDAVNSVLNGIAYHEARESFFVTGKNWNLMFEVKFSAAE